MNHKEQYIRVFRDLFGVDEAELNESFTFQNVDAWDWLTHLTLISELEATIDVLFETEDILHFGGFLNGMKILAGYGVDFDA